MNLEEFLLQTNQGGLTFLDYSNNPVYYRCPCGEINKSIEGQGWSRIDSNQQCNHCGTRYTTWDDFRRWPSISLATGAVFEYIRLSEAAEDALQIKCSRLQIQRPISHGAWSYDLIQKCLSQKFEAFEGMIHYFSGEYVFQSQESQLTNDLIKIKDITYEMFRTKGGNEWECLPSGPQFYTEPIKIYANEKSNGLLSEFFVRKGYRYQDECGCVGIEIEEGLTNHRVWRRHAFYSLNWRNQAQSIGHFFTIFHYFNLMLEKYPAFEQIAKLGYHSIISHWMNLYFKEPDKRYQVYKYLKAGTKESQIIPLPVFIRRWMKNADADFETYKRLLQIHEVSPIGEETFELYLDIEGQIDLTRMWRIIRNEGISFNEIIQYLNQCETRQAVSIGWALTLWDDYFTMARRCELEAKRFPQSVKLAHDVMVKNFNELGDDRYAKKFAERAAINQQWEYQNEELGFTMIVPKTVRELIDEGRTLRHCVGSYDKRVAKGSTVILFLRQIHAQDKPLYTVEWNPKQKEIVQARGKSNSSISNPHALKMLEEFKAKFA